MVQFCVEDLTFFRYSRKRKLRRLWCNAKAGRIMTADGATLRLQNQKNGWKNVYVHQTWNGEKYKCGYRALGCSFLHIRANTSWRTNQKELLSAYWVNGVRQDIRDTDIREGLKWVVAELKYPATRGIPIDRVNTHSLRGRGANTFHLAG